MMDADKQKVMELFDSDEPEELAKKYTKEQLNIFYHGLYGCYPGKQLRKIDIVRGIKKMKRGIDRALSMKP